jgi:hypothetical protein
MTCYLARLLSYRCRLSLANANEAQIGGPRRTYLLVRPCSLPVRN